MCAWIARTEWEREGIVTFIWLKLWNHSSLPLQTQDIWASVCNIVIFLKFNLRCFGFYLRFLSWPCLPSFSLLSIAVFKCFMFHRRRLFSFFCLFAPTSWYRLCCFAPCFAECLFFTRCRLSAAMNNEWVFSFTLIWDSKSICSLLPFLVLQCV